jgi:hypothetical protein
VGQEPDHQAVALADPLDALFSGISDLGQGGGWPIRELDIFEVGPQALDRVELGRVGGQPLDVSQSRRLSSQAGILVLQWADNPSQMSTTRWPA